MRSKKEQSRRAARRRLRARVLALLLRIMLRVARYVPLGAASRAGEAAGRLTFVLASERRRRALRHVALALRDRVDGRRRREIVATSFRTLLACAAEWLALSARGRDFAVSTVVRVDGMEHAEKALSRGRGIIAVTAHFGLFELLPVYFASLGIDGRVVGRRSSDEGLDALITKNRERMGYPSVPQQAAREILRVLRRGGIVGVLPDQDVDKLPGDFVPFFGRPAYTPTGPATLAVTTGALLVPIFTYRLGPGRHRIAVHPPVPDPGGEDREERVRGITAAFTRVIEETVAATPGHWAWVHERWSTPPEKLLRRRARRARASAKATRRRRKN